MFNIGVGPIINKKAHKPTQPVKKTNPPPYQQQQYNAMSLMKQQPPGQPMQPQMGMPGNSMNAPKPKEGGPPQPNPNVMKMESHPPQQIPKQPLPNPSIPSSGVSNVSSPAPMSSQTKNPPQKSGEKEKPSDISTTNLKIGSATFKKDKIMTKILYGKKQFIWEITQNPPKSAENDEDAKPVKRKFEVKFSDIEKIDINTETPSIHIDCKEKPKESKEIDPQPKKSANWSKADGETNIGDDKKIVIIAKYAKEALTKAQGGKTSHIDKIKKCDLNLFINGIKHEQMSVPSTPAKDPHAFSLEHNLHTPQSLAQQAMQLEQHHPPQKISYPPSVSHQESKQNDKIQPEDEEEDDEEKEFPSLTKEKKAEVKKFEQQLKSKTDQDKINFIMDTIKPKRFGVINQSKKIFKCPLYKCNVQKHNPTQMKNHLSQKHKKLVELGFGIDEAGQFTWKSDLIDYVLMVAKIYPKFVKNLIKEAKKN